MTALKKTGETTAQDAAAEFDLAGFLAGFTPYSPPVKVHKSGHLKVQIDDLYRQIKAKQKDEGEESIVDDGLEDLIREHNALVEQFEQDVAVFRFRPSTVFTTRAAQQAAVDAGIDIEAEGSMQDVYPYLWAETVTEPAGMTAEGFQALRTLIGDAAISELQVGWEQTSNGGAGVVADAPFSRSPLPTPTKGESSKS